MTLSLHIRTATQSDASALADLARRTFSDTFAADNDPADMQAYLDSALSDNKVDRELSDERSIFLLAFDQDAAAPCGYAKAVFPSAQPGAATGARAAFELSRLYVDRHALGRGAGAQLMRTVLEQARERHAGSIWLGVWEHNHRALAFYRKWGFEVVGEQSFLLGSDLQTDLVMSLRAF